MGRSIGTAEHKRLLALLRQILLDAGFRQVDVAKRFKAAPSVCKSIRNG